MAHAWREPFEEPALVYTLFGAGAALTLWTAERTLAGSVVEPRVKDTGWPVCCWTLATSLLAPAGS